MPGALDIVAETRKLETNDGSLFAVSVTTQGATPNDIRAYTARVIIYQADCTKLYEQTFPHFTEARLQERRLGDLPILMISALIPGISQSAYRHVLLAYDRGVYSIAPMNLETDTDGGGIYVGDGGASRGQGPGLTLWAAIWAGAESHFAPHQFEITQYRWIPGNERHSGWFDGPHHYITPGKFDPHPGEPDKVAKELGFSFGDLSQRERFTLTSKIYDEIFGHDH